MNTDRIFQKLDSVAQELSAFTINTIPVDQRDWDNLVVLGRLVGQMEDALKKYKKG